MSCRSKLLRSRAHGSVRTRRHDRRNFRLDGSAADHRPAVRHRGDLAMTAIRSSAYSELWGVVDGAVSDAFHNHQDYLTPKGQKSARTSVVKRVTGTVLSFAAQAARGRTYPPAETPLAIASSAAGEGASPLSPNHHCRIGRVTFRRVASSRRLVELNNTTNRLRAALIAHVTKAKEEGKSNG